MMKGDRKFWRNLVAVVGVVLGLTVMTTMAFARNLNPGVLPPNSHSYGMSYGEWSAKHWQWEFSLPALHHPLSDGVDCSAGQSGKVWFLGGTFASTEVSPGVILGQATRNCTVPVGKALFFPIVDVECSTIEGNGGTEAELRDCANFFADFIVTDTLACEIDGKSLQNLQAYRVESPLFTFGPLPDKNLLQSFGIVAPKGSTSPSVSDGVFLMLAPLSAGQHTIHFYGELDLVSIGGPTFIQDITYHITVVGGKK